MATYVFPSQAEMRLIEQTKMPELLRNRLGFSVMPAQNLDTDLLLWEQLDNYIGLQAWRGYNGQPTSVAQVGAKQYQAKPGVYGEFAVIDELTLSHRRQPGTFGTPIRIDDLVMEKQDQLLGRRLDRIEKIIWDLLVSGSFSVAAPQGQTVHTDSYTFQTFSAAVAWTTVATATPLQDFRAVQLKHRGYSVAFNNTATAYMNQKTANAMLNNTNSADLGGKRVGGANTINTVDDINRLLMMDGLPQVAIYDAGYLDASSVFQPFIADNKVVVAGRRPAGQSIGAYMYTRNFQNPDFGPGAYMKVIDRGEDRVPRTIEVHDGHNGGPVIWFPSAVVQMSV